MTKTKKLVYIAVFIGIGLTLPILTGQIQTIGKKLLPMHYPVFICGFVCGPVSGLICGAIVPILRSIVFGMPVLYPNAIAMSVELSVYGVVSGLIFKLLKNRKTLGIYVSLIVAMLIGRIVWGITEVILLGFSGKVFTMQAFLIGAFTDAFIGIIIQLILIPPITGILLKLNT